MWRILMPRIVTKQRFTVLTKNGGITTDGFLECIILYNALCLMHVGETMRCKPCYNRVLYHVLCDLNMEISVVGPPTTGWQEKHSSADSAE